jgi:hypothetical protein
MMAADQTVVLLHCGLTLLNAYSGDVTGRFQRDVNGHSGDVNKVGSAATLDCNNA